MIAVMLGILRMDVDSCIEAYMELSKDVFPHKNFLAQSKVIKFGKAVVGRARFDDHTAGITERASPPLSICLLDTQRARTKRLRRREPEIT